MLPVKTMLSLLKKIEDKVDSNDTGQSVFISSERSYDLGLEYLGNGISVYKLFHYGTLILQIERNRVDIDTIIHKTIAWIYSDSDRNAVNALIDAMNIEGVRYNRQGLNTIKEEF